MFGTKCLLLFPESIGDFILFTPFIYRIKELEPECDIHLYTSKNLLSLAKLNPSLSVVKEIPITSADKHNSTLRRQSILLIKEQQFHSCYFSNDYLYPIIKKANIPLIIKEPKNLLFRFKAKGSSPKAYSNRFITRSEMFVRNLNSLTNTTHKLDQFNFNLNIPKNPDIKKQFKLPKTYCVIMTDTVSWKPYEKDFFKQVIEFFLKHNLDVVVLGLKDLHQLNESYPTLHYLVGKTSLMQAAQIIDQCHAFVGIDSGTSHLASILNKQSLVLFTGKGTRPFYCGPPKPNSYFYKMHPNQSTCPLICPNHNKSCQESYCHYDYSWSHIHQLLLKLIHKENMTWKKKLLHVLENSFNILIVGKHNASLSHFMQTHQNLPISQIDTLNSMSLNQIESLLKKDRIRYILSVGPKQPLYYRFLHHYFRFTERWYCTFQYIDNIKDLPENPLENFYQHLTGETLDQRLSKEALSIATPK